MNSSTLPPSVNILLCGELCANAIAARGMILLLTFSLAKRLMVPVIKIKRVYEKPLSKDGYRVLVDRLWPRGVKKEVAALNEWVKDLAPSIPLRKWFGHDSKLWLEFRKRYRSELKNNEAVDEFVEQHQDKKIITLIYGAKDTEHNHAIILQNYLEQLFGNLS